MKVIQNDLWLCDECMSAVVNDDYTGLDYSYDEPEASRRMREIQDGLDELGPNLVSDFSDEDTLSCDDCGYRQYRNKFPYEPDPDGEGGVNLACPKCHSQDIRCEGSGVEEFTRGECDCCGSTLGGARYRFAVLGEESNGLDT